MSGKRDLGAKDARKSYPTIEEARGWYEEDDPVHGFDHVLRVLGVAERLGDELGADMEILRAAALLHDAEGAHPNQGDGRYEHEKSSASFARHVLRDKAWDPDRIEAVVHCIQSHRFRGEEAPRSLEAEILFDADKLDVNGAFGVARTIGYAIQAGQPIFAEPSEKFMREGESEPGERHSAYHEYLFKLRRIQDLLHSEQARRIGEGRDRVLKMFFEQLAAEARGEV
jgi:uncharacterized protein